MHMHWRSRPSRPRTALAVLAALTAIGVGLTTAGTAAANRNAIAAGHTISYVSPAGGSLCTLGFAFTRAGRALGITAGHTTIAAIEAPPTDQTICHTGRSTGSTCGQLAYQDRWGAQYLTEGHGDRAGYSGGPVWTRYGLDELAIVGIWLGTPPIPTTPSTAGSTRCPRPSRVSAWPPTHCSPPQTHWRPGRSGRTSA
jgi:hypothetical protein